MESLKKQLSEQEIFEQILVIERKIDEELHDPEKTNMVLVDEYFRQIRELDGGPEETKAELDAELRIIYRKAAWRKKKKVFLQFLLDGKRVASILLMVGLVSVFSVGVYAARAPIVQFLSKTYDKYIEFFFDQSDVEKAPSTIETVYTLGYLPEGYELDSQSIEREATVSIWQKKDGNSIKLNQDILTAVSTLDKEDRDIVSYNIEDIQILFKEKYGQKTYFWNTNEYQFRLFIVDNDISAEEGIELIRSIIKYEK